MALSLAELSADLSVGAGGAGDVERRVVFGRLTGCTRRGSGFASAISFIGLVIRAIVIGYVPEQTSGRNTTEKFADELNSTGMYSIVRHPLYLGNYITGLGISLIQLTVVVAGDLHARCFGSTTSGSCSRKKSFCGRSTGRRFESWAAETPAIWPRFSQMAAAQFAVLVSERAAARIHGDDVHRDGAHGRELLRSRHQRASHGVGGILADVFDRRRRSSI